MFAVFLLAAPLQTLVHEIAHFAVGRRHGWRTHLTSRATLVDSAVEEDWRLARENEPGSARYESLSRKRAGFLAAGYVANGVAAAIGILGLVALRTKRPRRVLLTDACTAAAALVALNGLVILMGGLQAPTGFSDLEKLAEVIDGSLSLLRIWAAAVGAVACTTAVLLVRLRDWVHFLPGALLGGATSYVAWSEAVGPWLLP